MKPLDQLLDRPIAYHRCLVDLCQSVTAAIMLSQALYWSHRSTDPERWFFKVREDWTQETGLSRWEQETARKRLRQTGFWQEKLKGVPAQIHYRIDLEKLAEALSGSVDKTPSDCQQVGGNPSNRPEVLPPSTNVETTQTLSLRGGGFKPPTIEEVKFQADKIGLPPIEAEKFWNKNDTLGWKVQGQPMVRWRSALATWKIHWETYRKENGTTYGNRQTVPRSGETRVNRNLGTANEGGDPSRLATNPRVVRA